MSDKTTKILENSIKSLRENLDSLSMDKFIATTIESLMNMEREEYLEKVHDPQEDKGNGHYERTLRSFSKNALLVNVPRTRKGLSLTTLELLKINREQMDDMVLALYKRGMTGGDIESFLQETFNEKISPAKISELSQTFHQFREAWLNSQLEKHYKVVFGDVVFVTVKRGDEYEKEAVFVAYGVREDNRRELLVLDINPTESAQYWSELLKELKEKRGVETIDLFVADGLKSLEDEVKKIYPEADFQKCVVHRMKNFLNRTSPKDKAAVSEDLKKVFDNFDSGATVEKALTKVENFLKKWSKKYPSFKDLFAEGNIEYYFTYIKYAPEVRRMIYTSNSIENLNRQIRKTSKNKLSFESPERLLDYLFMILKDFEEKNLMKHAISNYKYFRKLTKNEVTPDTII